MHLARESLLRRFSNRYRRGFTLVELMISIALSLLLILGVNALFKISAKTVGTGMASSVMSRDLRGAQTLMDHDFSDLYQTPFDEQPAIIMQSMNQVAFRDQLDEKTNLKYAAANSLENILWTDPTGNSPVGNYVSPPRLGNTALNPSIVLDNRNHRVDRMAFFVHGFHRRQTADQAESAYQSGLTSNEAYIRYGHVRQPDGTSANWVTPSKYLAPDSQLTNNPENKYAAKWILGRHTTLLVAPDPNSSAIRYYDPVTNIQSAPLDYYGHDATPARQPNLSPLAYGSQSNSDFNFEDGRIDLAGTTMGTFRGFVEDYALTSVTTGAGCDHLYPPSALVFAVGG